jgi:hypothetical protein
MNDDGTTTWVRGFELDADGSEVTARITVARSHRRAAQPSVEDVPDDFRQALLDWLGVTR